jgi:ABC-2 type transport system ATP-binding protein
MEVVTCEKLTKKIRGRDALKQLNLKLEGDKLTGLIGRNGAGKTTLMKILAGFWKGSSGKVEVFGKRPFQNLFVSVNTIYVDDTMYFDSSLRLDDILKEAANFYPNFDSELAKRLFNYFSFQPYARHGHLSKGKRSTFNMIIGLASRCKLTMLDEPTTGMDASVRKDFYRALLKDYLAHPRTILISSHHLEEIEDILEEVILVDEGELVVHETMEWFKEHAYGITGRTEIVQNLLREEDVIYQKEIGDHLTYVVVNQESSSLPKAKEQGMTIEKISPNDLSIYLTSKRKGEIDDVFK